MAKKTLPQPQVSQIGLASANPQFIIKNGGGCFKFIIRRKRRKRMPPEINVFSKLLVRQGKYVYIFT